MLISGMKNCVIILGFAQQVRIHESSGCRILLVSKSGPIIEDCVDMHFGAYPRGLEGGVDVGEGKGEGENWRDVQDFNWLKQTASPHFDLDARVDEEGIKKVLIGEAEVESLFE